MSNTNDNRRHDVELDADLTAAADDRAGDPTPARLGGAPAPDASGTDEPDAGTVDPARETLGGGGRPGSVETVDEAAAERDAIRDETH